MPDAKSAGRNRRANPQPATIRMRRALTGIATGMALQYALPVIEAQEYELVPPNESESPSPQGLPQGAMPQTGQGIAVRARIDVLFFPPGGTEPILVQRAFTTSAATNQSSQFVFDVLNDAALEGVNQALAGGAKAGRISVVAMCYAYGPDSNGTQAMSPMGLFINTTDLNVTADGKAAVHSNIQVMPPNGR